jgi:hypothetical protein
MSRFFILFKLQISLLLVFTVGSYAQLNINIGNLSNTNTITCFQPVVTMTATSNTYPVSYTWTSASSTLIGDYVNISQPGTWTVTGQFLNNPSAVGSQTFNIYQNIATPTIAVNPSSINLICNTSAPSFTGLSNVFPNITTNWIKAYGSNSVYVGSSQSSSTNIFQPTSPGVYYFISTSNLNGCSSTQSVLVNSSTGVPSFSLVSSTNFSLGCSSASITNLQVSSVQTDPLNQPVSYAFVPPPGTATPVFTSNPGFNNISVPGTYVVYVRDLTNNCQVSQSITIVQNTVSPNAYHVQPLNILSCRNPSMTIKGFSDNTNTSITWSVPSIPNPTTVSGQNLNVNVNPSAIGSSVNVTIANIYTLQILDNASLCKSNKIVQIAQDIRIPTFAISALTNSVITCGNPEAILFPVITTVIAVQLVPTYTWCAPNFTCHSSAQHNASVPGTHTAISISSVNGCSASAVYFVGIDNALAVSDQTIVANCPFTNALILPNYPNGTLGLTFNWQNPLNSITSSLNQSTVNVNSIGDYTCIVTNTVSNCTNTFVCKMVCSTSLQEFDMLHSVQVYPNPAENYLFIKCLESYKELILQIFASDGRLVKLVKIENDINRINLDLASGVYIYKLTNEEGSTRSGKIIVK